MYHFNEFHIEVPFFLLVICVFGSGEGEAAQGGEGMVGGQAIGRYIGGQESGLQALRGGDCALAASWNLG